MLHPRPRGNKFLRRSGTFILEEDRLGLLLVGKDVHLKRASTRMDSDGNVMAQPRSRVDTEQQRTLDSSSVSGAWDVGS